MIYLEGERDRESVCFRERNRDRESNNNKVHWSSKQKKKQNVEMKYFLWKNFTPSQITSV